MNLFSVFKSKLDKEDFSYNDGPYKVRLIRPEETGVVDMVYKLRHDVFSKELGWFEFSKDKKEHDHYDNNAKFFGVFDPSGNLIGCSRIIERSEKGFMLDNEFNGLLDRDISENIDISRAVEVSRTTVRKDFRGIGLRSLTASENLLKIMYMWSILNNKRYWLFAVDEKYLNKLTKSFKVVKMHVIGKRIERQKRTVTVGVMVDLEESKLGVMLFMLKSFLNKIQNQTWR